VNETELHLSKEYLKGSLTLSLESSASRMMRLGRNEFTFGRQFATEEIEAAIDAVTIDDVARLARTLLASDQRGLVVLGPLEPADVRFDAPRLLA
jgi:predicted Zn-dependent peptidase